MRLTREEMIEVLTSRTKKLDGYTDAQLKRALTALAPPKSAIRSGGGSRTVEVTNAQRRLHSALVYTRARRWDPATPIHERLALDKEIGRIERAIKRLRGDA